MDRAPGPWYVMHDARVIDLAARFFPLRGSNMINKVGVAFSWLNVVARPPGSAAILLGSFLSGKCYRDRQLQALRFIYQNG